MSMIAAVSLLLVGLGAFIYAAINFGMAEATSLPRLRRTARTARAVGIVFVVVALAIGIVDLT